MQEEIWYQNHDGLKFVEYLGDGSDEKVKSIGVKLNNALSSDMARGMYGSRGNIVFLVDGDEVVANTYYDRSLNAFNLFWEKDSQLVTNHRYLLAFYRMLDERGVGDQFVEASTYPSNADQRLKEMESLRNDFSSAS